MLDLNTLAEARQSAAADWPHTTYAADRATDPETFATLAARLDGGETFIGNARVALGVDRATGLPAMLIQADDELLFTVMDSGAEQYGDPLPAHRLDHGEDDE
ncbi:hypothetical protein [Asticcacaulis sp.]|uniref:hypothetical protein n=1 Tax=Asticcacaulis sp. TaxID=1872648 RepID=UPI00262D5902|nr:hypothetical protein [Asticcacaulis sp.]